MSEYKQELKSTIEYINSMLFGGKVVAFLDGDGEPYILGKDACGRWNFISKDGRCMFPGSYREKEYALKFVCIRARHKCLVICGASRLTELNYMQYV